MNDYFDQLELELREAVTMRRHLPWYTRMRLPVRGRGLLLVLAGLVVATPAVGAAAGWFSPGKPDAFYPASATGGLGKVLPKGDRLLPIRVADPAGGPPWGIRLVKTTRGDTCIQVGRVEDGQIGALGIDGAWHNDHEFHEINANDEQADICGATDAAGNGFANETVHGAPPNVDVSLYGHSGGAVSDTRMIFAGLLGPDAKSITYRTTGGQTKTESTSGGVGAYLIVLRETAKNCRDFTQTLIGGSPGCENDGTANQAALRGPTAVTSVTYDSGKTCNVQPSAQFTTAYRAFEKRLQARRGKEPVAEVRAQTDRFFASVGIGSSPRDWVAALIPECKPVGWVAPRKQRITASDVASPLKVSISEGRRFCSKGPWLPRSVQDNTVVCDRKVPKGYTSYWQTPEGASGPLFALVRVSFTAREPVTTSNSFYEWNIKEPGNNGGKGNRTQANVRRGERVTFTMAEPIPGTDGGVDTPRGVYHATISFESNVGQAGPENGGGVLQHDGVLTVGKFSFRLPLPHR